MTVIDKLTQRYADLKEAYDAVNVVCDEYKRQLEERDEKIKDLELDCTAHRFSAITYRNACDDYSRALRDAQSVVHELRHTLRDAGDCAVEERENHAKTKIELEAAHAKIEELQCEFSICRGEYDPDPERDGPGDADEAVPGREHAGGNCHLETPRRARGAEGILYASPPLIERSREPEPPCDPSCHQDEGC